MYYELATLTLRLGSTPEASAAVRDYVHGDGACGELLGCWFSDIGELNQIVLLRSFTEREELQAERRRALFSANPFGCADWLTNFEMHSYAPFPWMPPVRPGKLGPIYEIRTYELRPGGLQPTLDAWEAALPARTAISPCVAAIYALDGAPRVTHIWPAPSLDARAQARAAAVEQGIWPPKGGPAWLTTRMRSNIVRPFDFSPLA